MLREIPIVSTGLRFAFVCGVLLLMGWRAQEDPRDGDRFRRIREYVGTITVREEVSFEKKRPGDGTGFLGSEERSKVSCAAEYSVILRNGGGNSWTGSSTMKGTVEVENFLEQRYDPKSGVHSTTFRETWSGTGPSVEKVRVDLEIRPESGTYDLSIPPFSIRVRHEQTSTGQDPISETSDYNACRLDADMKNVKLPTSGLTLSGSATPAWFVPEKDRTHTLTVSWNLVPEGEDPLEVVVEPEGYDRWIPRALGQEEKTDERIAIHARLQRADGSRLTEVATKFTFELTDVSAEPGTCLNQPKEPKKTPDRDLRFENQPGLQRLDAQGQRAETTAPALVEAKAVVSCFDWGAWGTIRVLAEVQGRVIVGHLKGDKQRKLIPLPKRSDRSKIADAWKKSVGADGRADEEDADELPKGCHDGDGLTLYEEYRGSYVGGRHRRGDPKVKELFVLDRIGGRSKSGIAIFTAAGRLMVHHELTLDEVTGFDPAEEHAQNPPGIRINFNHDQGPRKADKYVVLLTLLPQALGYAFADGGPGRPKRVTMTLDFDPSDWNVARKGRTKVVTDLYGVTIAHEMFHCCNLPHHGEDDQGELAWPPTPGAIALREDGTPTKVARSTIYLGIEGGQHSGVEDCVMRYDCAEAYASKSALKTYYVPTLGEMTGLFLCDSKKGDGVNSWSRRPQSRYGDASTGGECRRRVCVNDSIRSSPNHR